MKFSKALSFIKALKDKFLKSPRTRVKIGLIVFQARGAFTVPKRKWPKKTQSKGILLNIFLTNSVDA